jgi:D-arabinose 1-dehydrogenase-like Zn-dependent alcohol dehydrogenase
MKAARLQPGAVSATIEDVPDPVLRPASAVIRLDAAFVSPFITRVIDGSGGYTTPPRPFTPGTDAIGTVEAVAGSIRGLDIGQRVYCDMYIEPDHPAATGERAFIGNFAMGPQSVDLLQEWPDGVYAEKVCLPVKCVFPIGSDIPVAAPVLCRLGWLATAYAGLRKANMAPGAVVAVNGASGLLGSSAVVAALALGASWVIAIGRRKEALNAVAALDGRVIAATDAASVPPVDVALTSVDGDDSASLAALLPHVRRHGTFVVVGAPHAPLSLNVRWLMANDITLRGSIWFGRSHIDEIMRLTACGQLKWSGFDAELFPLSRISEALASSKSRSNPLRHVAIDLA